MKTVTQDAINAYLKEVENSVNANAIDEIINLSAKFRFSAAINLLTNDEIKVITKTGVRKAFPTNWNKTIYTAAIEAVRNMCYKNADFGRYKSTHLGVNVLPSMVSIRYERGLRYNRKFTSNDLYSDFFFAMSEKSNFDFLVKTAHSEKVKSISFFELEKYLQYAKDGECYSFIYNNPLFKKLNFEFDKKEISIKYKGYEYHITDAQVFATNDMNKKTILNILKAFQERKRMQKKDVKFNNLPLEKIFVTKEDSIQSGNCVIYTDQVAKQIAAKNNIIGEYALRADVLLNTQNDNYTRRAILKAYENGNYIHN